MRVTLAGVGQDPALTFSLEGRLIAARPGDSIASAAIAAGELTCRTSASGQARGVFCGMGVCHECVMVVDGRPARTCMTPARAGAVVTRLSADSPAPSPNAAPASVELEPELLVVGAGPAGMAAAAAAAEAGVDVVVLDERAKLGGQYFKQPAATIADERLLDAQYREGRALIERLQSSGARVLAGMQVWAVGGAHEVFVMGAEQRMTLRPQRLVVASGAYERGVPMPGWTLPGFMTTGAAQTLLRAYQVLPGRRVLVSGNGPLNLQVAAELVRAGATVEAVCEAAPIMSVSRATSALAMGLAAPKLAISGLAYLRTLRDAGVPLLKRSAVVRAEGPGRVRRATIAEIDGAGRPLRDTERSFDVDAVCIGFGFMPSNEIVRSLGVEHRFDAVLGQLVAVRDRRGRSSVPDVWVIGDGGGVRGARVALSTGTLAGLDVAETLGRTLPEAARKARRRANREAGRNERFQRALVRQYEATPMTDQLVDDDTLVCRCEEVSMAQVDAAFASGITSLGALKRVTRAGMGRCQGRYCAPVLADLASRGNARAVDEAAWFAPAPPFKPVPVDRVVAPPPTERSADVPERTATGQIPGPHRG